MPILFIERKKDEMHRIANQIDDFWNILEETESKTHSNSKTKKSEERFTTTTEKFNELGM